MLSSADLTALIPERWPYAPTGARIGLRDPSTFSGDWYGCWVFAQRTALINNALDDDMLFGVIAHELGHGRWSTPLPPMDGEDGARLLLTMFDEIRTERFAIAARPEVADELRPWATRVLHDNRYKVTNMLSGAIAYGYIVAACEHGMLTRESAESVRVIIADKRGAHVVVGLDDMLAEVYAIRPGETGDLVRAARKWARWVTLCV